MANIESLESNFNTLKKNYEEKTLSENYESSELYKLEYGGFTSSFGTLINNLNNLYSQATSIRDGALKVYTSFEQNEKLMEYLNQNVNSLNSMIEEIKEIPAKIYKASSELYNEKKLIFNNTDNTCKDLITKIKTDINNYKIYYKKWEDAKNSLDKLKKIGAPSNTSDKYEQYQSSFSNFESDIKKYKSLMNNLESSIEGKLPYLKKNIDDNISLLEKYLKKSDNNS